MNNDEQYVVVELVDSTEYAASGNKYSLVYGPVSYNSCLGYYDVMLQHKKGRVSMMNAQKFFTEVKNSIKQKRKTSHIVITLSPTLKKLYESGEYILC